jgi:murein DD-endopeptidase MepM/ murein hydrolase activator NlpD
VRLCWLLAFVVASAGSQNFSVTPQSVRQGETLKVRGEKSASKLRIGEEIVPMFPEKDDSSFGLFPIRVKERPGQHELDFLDESGVVIHSAPVLVRSAHYGTQNVVLSRSLTALKASADERETMEVFRKTISPVRYWEEPLGAPLGGCMTSRFGVQRLHNGKPTGDYHGGIDQRATAGTAVRAVAAGLVRVAHQFELRGGTVAIDHGQGLESVYLHMSQLAATEEAVVQKGDIIGYVGSTGRSTAPHLHWALYVDGQPVNPEQWVHLKPCEVAQARGRTTIPGSVPDRMPSQ